MRTGSEIIGTKKKELVRQYQPSTTTPEFNDFEEAINELHLEDKLRFLIRLLYGREIVVIENSIVLHDSFDSEGVFRDLYPRDKDAGMKIILESMNLDTILETGRKCDDINPLQWYGFLNYFIEYSPSDKVESI